MKPSSPLQKTLVSILGLFLAIVVFLNVVQMTSPARGPKDTGYSLFSLISDTLIEGPIRSWDELNQRIASLWSVQSENKALRTQIELLSTYQAKLEESYRDIEALRKLNELKTSYSQYSLINASIASRSMDSFNHSLTLDVGSADGVALDDAVISSTGLIGKIIEVDVNRSVVLLLTTEQSLNKVTVKIQVDAEKTAEAILEQYDPNQKAYVLSLLDTSSTITEGMRVITSGLGGAFPSGLLVGTVTKVETLADAIGLRIEVNPSADFYHIDYVAVVKR